MAVWPLLRRRWQRVAVICYPLATLFCIIVTANHYWIDGVGGLVCLAAGYGVARVVTRPVPRAAPAEV